jgi:Acetyltransferase (GNAT) domain
LNLPEFFCERLTDFSPATGTFLFNQKAHLQLQSKTGWLVYGLREKPGKILIKIFFCLKEGIASSPYRAPFGGWELDGKVTVKQADFFINRLIDHLKSQGIKKIEVKNSPVSYHPFAAQLFLRVAKKFDFSIHQEVSSIIPVDSTFFERKIVIAKRQKLLKGEARFIFCQENRSQLKRIYSFIEACRQERHQALSMSYPQIKKTVASFPQDYFLFSVKEDERLAAAAIVIRVSEKILYTFYYAHTRHFDKVSPVVFLIKNLYSFAKKNKYRMIDLGTSMVHGRVNQPLLHFKKSIGGLSVQKYSFEKEFEKKL